MTKRRVLFLCTINYFRSRFAELLFESLALRMGLNWTATSRGLALERAMPNSGPMARAAVSALDKMGICNPAAMTRSPCGVLETDFAEAAWIVALHEREHRPLMVERFPTWENKIEYWHIDDSNDLFANIEREVMDLISRLMRGGVQRHVGPLVAEPPTPAVNTSKPKKLGLARVGRETAGRRGKGVTTIFDIAIDEAGLKELATKLKNLCGTGGTVKDGRIEIQGDHRDKIVSELEKLGYQVKRSGG